MTRVVLFGTGRGAAIAHRFLAADSSHEVVGFTVDDEHLAADTHRGLPLVGFGEVENRFPPDDFEMLILLGYQQMNRLRQRKFEEAKAKGYRLASYVSSSIFQPEPIQHGENCFIHDNQSISLDVRIGDNVVMWSSNHIGDLSVIEDHAWVASHVTVAAEVTIGPRAVLGIGATVTNGVHVGEEALVGADVLVTDDVAPKSVLVAGKGKIEFEALPFMRAMIGGGKL